MRQKGWPIWARSIPVIASAATLQAGREVADGATNYGVLQTKFAASSLSPCPEYAA